RVSCPTRNANRATTGKRQLEAAQPIGARDGNQTGEGAVMAELVYLKWMEGDGSEAQVFQAIHLNLKDAQAQAAAEPSKRFLGLSAGPAPNAKKLGGAGGRASGGLATPSRRRPHFRFLPPPPRRSCSLPRRLSSASICEDSRFRSMA